MTLSYWQRRSREPDLTVDVAVVGGGVIGCSTAYWLGRRRAGRTVAIVEAGRLAQGASGRNAGFILQGTSRDYLADLEDYGAARTRRLWQFTRENRDLLFSELRPHAFHLEPSGSLVVAANADEDARLRAAVGPMRADGAPTAYVPAGDTNRRLLSRGFHGSLYVASGAVVDPALLVRHLAQESGARVLEHHAVGAIERGPEGVVLETPHRRIHAARVVLALGAYLPRLVPAAGRYVRPVRAQMLATAPGAERWLHVPVYSHQGYFYLRQLADGAVLVGGARHLHAETEVGYDDDVTGALQSDLERYLHGFFPQTRGLAVRNRWSGTMGFSPDHLPVVGGLDGHPGSYYATGFTGHGMGYGVRFGRLLAELSDGERAPEGLDLFTAARFDAVPARADGR